MTKCDCSPSDGHHQYKCSTSRRMRSKLSEEGKEITINQNKRSPENSNQQIAHQLKNAINRYITLFIDPETDPETATHTATRHFGTIEGLATALAITRGTNPPTEITIDYACKLLAETNQ